MHDLTYYKSELEKVRQMIRAFCEGQRHADPYWKAQKHIKPLFDYEKNTVEEVK